MECVLPQEMTIHEAFSHFALAGLSMIAHRANMGRVRLWWSRDDEPRAHLSFDGEETDLAKAVIDYARCALEEGWLTDALPYGGKEGRRVFLPAAGSTDAGLTPQQWAELDATRAAHWPTDRLSSDLLEAWGEPAWWRIERKGHAKQGESRWLMVPRNGGSNILGARLEPMAEALAARDVDSVVAALEGSEIVCSLKPESRTRSVLNLAMPRITDDVFGWAAAAAFSLDPVVRNLAGASFQAMIDRDTVRIPVWTDPVTPAVMRATVRSRFFTDPAMIERCGQRGVTAVLTCPIYRTQAKSPEVTVLPGELTLI